jgi:hypothetical protein
VGPGGPYVVGKKATGGPYLVSKKATGAPYVLCKKATGGPHVVSKKATCGPHVVSKKATGRPIEIFCNRILSFSTCACMGCLALTRSPSIQYLRMQWPK